MKTVPVEALDPAATRARGRACLDAAMAWAPEAEAHGLRVMSGWLEGHSRRAWASRVHIAAPPERVAAFIADEMIERLPEWSREFADGEVVEHLDPGDARFRRVVRARYETPWPLANREYVYWLERFDDDDGILVTYQSVTTSIEPPTGTVRATLDATAHRVRLTPDGAVLDHVLVTDLGGSLPGWLVDHVFRGGLRKAHLRDAHTLRSVIP